MIYLKTIELIGNYGFRFTTDDLARELAVSKRTLYSYFSSKEKLIEKTIDYIFAERVESDFEILNDPSMAMQEKLKRILSNIPTSYNIGYILKHIDELQRFYPSLWEKSNNMLDRLWDATVTIVLQGIEANQIRSIDVRILRLVLNESFKKLFDYNYLNKNQMKFEDALEEMNHIILYGLLANR